MLKVRLEGNHLHIGERLSVSFQRTLRVPDDGATYPLPPGLGMFPVHRVADYTSRVPDAWREENSFFIPMYQREALWLGFDGTAWKPNAVKIGIGRIDAVSGEAWQPDLHADPQNYLVCPQQPWLDGINTGSRSVRQFVVMPLGSGYTIEGQLTGHEQYGGIQILVFEPKPGRFPDSAPAEEDREIYVTEAAAIGEMGIAAGAPIEQAIYRDPYGIDAWDPTDRASVSVHIVNSEEYKTITDREPPATPIDARTYTERGFPWFQLYDETRPDVTASERLARVKSTGELDETKTGRKSEDDRPVNVPDEQIRKLKPKRRSPS